jgi:hypothetical protein
VDVNPYEVLGIAPDADRDTIRAAYRRRAREAHPDSGGDDAEFAAVALAWWTLSSPERRARYDAGLGEDEDDWGEDLGWDEAVPPPRPTDPPAEPRPTQEADPSSDGAGDETPRPTAVPPTPPRAPVDALTSEPRELPAAPPPAGMASPWDPAHRKVTLWAASALLLLVAGVMAALIAVPSLAEGDVSSAAWAAVIAYAGALYWSLRARARAHEAGPFVRFFRAATVWGSVAFFALMGSGYLLSAFAPARAWVVGVPLVAGAALAADSGRRLRRTRAREGLARHSRRQRALARRWNRVLTLRAQHGAAHVEVGQREGRAVWVLVADRSGQVLDWAPARAPLAWAALMRAAGIDVLPVPRPVPGAREAAGRVV